MKVVKREVYLIVPDDTDDEIAKGLLDEVLDTSDMELDIISYGFVEGPVTIESIEFPSFGLCPVESATEWTELTSEQSNAVGDWYNEIHSWSVRAEAFMANRLGMPCGKWAHMLMCEEGQHECPFCHEDTTKAKL